MMLWLGMKGIRRLSDVKYYLENNKNTEDVWDIFECKKQSLSRWVERYVERYIRKYFSLNNIKAVDKLYKITIK